MKKIISLMFLTFLFSLAGFAQEKMNMDMGMSMEPTEKDKTEAIPVKGFLKRGAPLTADAKKVSLADALKNPSEYAGKNVLVEGVIVRSCKMEGCWLELAPAKDAQSIRVKMKDHAFFVPLDSAGANAKVEGVFSVKTLSKEEVQHMMTEDGAKFENINKDGTVTEISLDASGVELTRAS